MADAFEIDTPSGPLPARVYDADEARTTLILAHGAGAGQNHPWMRERAADLAARGVRVVTFDFPYIAARRRVPDRAPVLIDAWRHVIDVVHQRFIDIPLAIGGKSLGGRMATMVLAGDAAPVAVRGCVALGYPLHPPGKPEQLRVAHLSSVRVPLLVLQGARDPFGGPEEIEREFAAAGARATVVPVPSGGHSFEVRGKDARQADVFASVADTVTQWLRAQGSGPGGGLRA